MLLLKAPLQWSVGRATSREGKGTGGREGNSMYSRGEVNLTSSECILSTSVTAAAIAMARTSMPLTAIAAPYNMTKNDYNTSSSWGSSISSSSDDDDKQWEGREVQERCASTPSATPEGVEALKEHVVAATY